MWASIIISKTQELKFDEMKTNQVTRIILRMYFITCLLTFFYISRSCLASKEMCGFCGRANLFQNICLLTCV